MSGDLEQLLEDGVIDEVLSRLKSGKEADVWLVRHRDEVLAAKVYKERSIRSFKNNSGYKEGRMVRNTRTQRAMDRGSRFGQEAAEEAWKSAESDALHKLHAQGVRVPAPVLFYEGILLMKLVLDIEGRPAPRLIDVAFEPAAAAQAYADLRAQAVRMLCSDLIHGDLSAYNVLLAAEGPTIIDFPQVISAAQNSTAAEFFMRDIENLRTFFTGFDPALAARTGDGPEIWRAYVRRELSPEFVPSGRPVREPEPRARQDGARQHGATQRRAGAAGSGGAPGAHTAHSRGPQQHRSPPGQRGHPPGPPGFAPRVAPAARSQARFPDAAPGRPRHRGQQHGHDSRPQPAQGAGPHSRHHSPVQAAHGGQQPRPDSRGQAAHGGQQPRPDSRGQAAHGGQQPRPDSRGQAAHGGPQARHNLRGQPARGGATHPAARTGPQKAPGGSHPPPARNSQGARARSPRPQQHARPAPVVERVHRPAPQSQHPRPPRR